MGLWFVSKPRESYELTIRMGTEAWACALVPKNDPSEPPPFAVSPHTMTDWPLWLLLHSLFHCHPHIRRCPVPERPAGGCHKLARSLSLGNTCLQALQGDRTAELEPVPGESANATRSCSSILTGTAAVFLPPLQEPSAGTLEGPQWGLAR